MTTVLIVFGVGAAAILALALFSDRRDHRQGIDPKLRVEDLARRRQDLREERVNRRARRYLRDLRRDAVVDYR